MSWLTPTDEIQQAAGGVRHVAGGQVALRAALLFLPSYRERTSLQSCKGCAAPIPKQFPAQRCAGLREVAKISFQRSKLSNSGNSFGIALDKSSAKRMRKAPAKRKIK